MKKLTLKALVTTTLATLVITAPAHAGSDNSERQQKRMLHKIEKISDKLDLDKNQQAQWVELAKAHYVQKMENRKQMQSLQQKLRETQKKHTANSSEVNEIADKIAEQTRQNVLLKAKHQQELKQILNHKQLAELEEMREKKQKRFKKRRAKRGSCNDV